MRRREFIAALGGAAAWPLVARAQQKTLPVIGFLSMGAAGAFAPYVAGFKRGLEGAGYIDGRNAVIEFRWAEGHRSARHSCKSRNCDYTNRSLER